MLTPQNSYVALLVVQTLHLFQHRLLFMSTHLILIVVQVVGSLWIKKLSPQWQD